MDSQFTSETLILKPDPVKQRIFVLGLPTILVIFLGFLLFAIFDDIQIGFLVVLAIGAVTYWFGFRYLRRMQKESLLELSSNGLALTLFGDTSFHAWRDLSRITLLENTWRDDHGKFPVHTYYLSARLLSSKDENPDHPTEESDADLLIPIDMYISHHRFSGRTEEQEAACKSAPDLANTLNAWRDFALDIEIAAIPTPIIQTETDKLSELARSLRSGLTS
ncbi:hypothetical protein ABVF61_26520 [Roseibium sp. HPY-6]|uniref:hypothetical protein n=1 Tax=Roseibium sp. HPY-6 TaxID=3229852 RepID=UPI00338D8C7F